MQRVHVTCVALDGVGLLLRGPSGGGKSDLALRLIDAGARLVADDYADLEVKGGRLVATAPETIAGLIEVRGIGVLRVGCLPEAPVALVVDLVPAGAVDRLPEPAVCTDYGLALPLVRLDPFQSSAPAKLRLALRLARGDLARADG
ncbi:MAG: HPr kinase/phosphatase C-terminal domain-containing protein [Magnetospirillum sp. WYHS-4]